MHASTVHCTKMALHVLMHAPRVQVPSPRRVPHGDREPFRPLQFDDPQLAFESKSTGELMRAYAVFTACQVG